MKITNKKGLPQSFVDMAQEEYFEKENEYRVTALLAPIRETILKKRYKDQIEVDVSDMVWLLFGKAVHNVLENHQEADHELKEERIKVPFQNTIISGQFDLYNSNEKKITDYKTASVWKFIYKDFEDWKHQTLIYCWLMNQIGFDANKGEIVAFLKDHSKTESERKKDYPQEPVQTVEFEFTDDDLKNIEHFIHGRVLKLKENENTPDDQLPLCTEDERFNSGTKYAVKKGNNKRAVKVFSDHKSAQEFVEQKAKYGADKNHWIEERPGEDKRCKWYCFVNEFCDYYHTCVKEGEKVV